MFDGFECCLCGSWSYDGDLLNHVCLRCIDNIDWGTPDNV